MISFLIFLGTYLLMECVTWCTHKFVMHGFLWYLHADHDRFLSVFTANALTNVNTHSNVDTNGAYQREYPHEQQNIDRNTNTCEKARNGPRFHCKSSSERRSSC